MENIIFLDVDGVMNTEKDRSVNKDAVKRLADLVNKTESKLIYPGKPKSSRSVSIKQDCIFPEGHPIFPMKISGKKGN